MDPRSTFAISIIFMGCTKENQSTQATIARSVQPAYEKTFTDLHLGEAHFYKAFIPDGAEKWVHFGMDTYIDGQLQEVTQELSTGNFIERNDDNYDLGLVLMNHGDKILAQLSVDGTSTSLYELPKAQWRKVKDSQLRGWRHFEQLAEKGFNDIDHAKLNMEKAQSNYIWDYFNSVEGLKQQRIQALTDCSNDMIESPNRYVPAVLPVLPFKDNEFELTLSAHFLFMYGDRFDYNFHMQSIQELLRVTSDEVRIFPLIDLSCNRYEHVDKIVDFIQSQGYITEEIKVPYEFQKGANRMLVIKKV